MQNNPDPPGERHGGAFLPPPLGNVQRPCGQPVFAAAVQHHRRRLIQRRAQPGVAGTRDVTNDVALMLLQTLKILEQFDLSTMEHNSTDYIRLLSEVMKRATVDKDRYVATPRNRRPSDA